MASESRANDADRDGDALDVDELLSSDERLGELFDGVGHGDD